MAPHRLRVLVLSWGGGDAVSSKAALFVFSAIFDVVYSGLSYK